LWYRGLMAGVSAVAVAGIVAPAPAATAGLRFHRDHVLGTSLDLLAVAPDEACARIAAGAAMAEIARLDRVLSAYRADSELTMLNAVAEHDASPDLFAVIAACERWRRDTDGAFSARLGAALSLWRDGAVPDPQRLQAAAARAEAARVDLDPARRRIARPDGVVFHRDALAKGYVIDAAMAAARRAAPALAGLMVDIGGDLRVWGRAPHADGWRIGVAAAGQVADNAPPAAILALADQAVAFSGRGMRDLAVAAGRASHILSPRTGQPVAHSVAASVIAPTAADADALATAFSVLTPAEALALAARLPGVEALLVDAQGRAEASSGWRRLAAATPVSATAPWPGGFALSIDYEIPRFEADDYRAPYVLVWITDEKRNLVRTLLMLGNDQKWVDSNYVWWRRYGRKTPEIVSAIARPTRLPGRYNVVWDGKDDSGKPVGQGKYLVHVEAAREHGGHSYQFADIELGAAATDKPVAGKEEIGALTIRRGAPK